MAHETEQLAPIAPASDEIDEGATESMEVDELSFPTPVARPSFRRGAASPPIPMRDGAPTEAERAAATMPAADDDRTSSRRVVPAPRPADQIASIAGKMARATRRGGRIWVLGEAHLHGSLARVAVRMILGAGGRPLPATALETCGGRPMLPDELRVRDILLVLASDGRSRELGSLIDLAKRRGARVMAMLGFGDRGFQTDLDAVREIDALTRELLRPSRKTNVA